MSFSKLVMTVLLKLYAAGNIFVKICLKAIRDTFFSNLSLWEVQGGPMFRWRWYQREGENSNF